MSTFRNQAFLNFTEAEPRRQMEEALKRVRAEFGRTYRLKDGQVVSEKSPGAMASVNPSRRDEILGYVQMASKADAEQALKTVFDFSKTWRFTPAAQRIALTEKLADWMLERRLELAAWMVFEVGKNWREADADVCEAIDFCRYYALEMKRLASPRLMQDVPGERDYLTYHPKGVSVVIAPWNFPLAILCGMTVASLVTGNTVVFKPAETSMIIAAKLAQGLREVGFPEGSFYFLPGVGEEIGPQLVEDPRVDVIAFTGSAAVGLSIIESANRKPKPGQRGVKKVIAEMGGKNALIVDEDADLDEALKAALHSAFGFQGQKCSALSRLLVHEKIYDTFIPRFCDAVKNLKLGMAENPESDIGPVIDDEAQARIQKTISEATKRAKLLAQATSDAPEAGFFVKPSVFEITDPQDFLFQNEIFGPVVAVMKIPSFEKGLELANAVPYALTGGLFSRNPSHIEKVKTHFEVGNLYINRAITGALVERHPFGGFKLSGVGSKAGGPDYLLQFLEPRAVAENTVRRGFEGVSA